MELLIGLMNLERRGGNLTRRSIFKALDKKRIHPEQSYLLTRLATGPCSQSELAKWLEVSAAAVAVSVRRMKKAGLLHSQPDPNDQRTNSITITPKGEEMLRYAQESFQDVCLHKYDDFTEGELLALQGYLERICHNLETYHQTTEERI